MLNKVILMGRLTRDPELRHTQSNRAVCSFSLAVNRDFAPQGGQAQTDFVDIVAWGKTGEFVSKYFVKGQLVAVTGRLQSRTWEDKNGNKRVTIEVNAEEVHFAEPKRSSQNSGDRYENSAPSRNNQAAPASFDFDDSDFSEIADDDGDLPF
ncbi:MAG: single-stranded DNA-binding protein [Clostridia bacterium]